MGTAAVPRAIVLLHPVPYPLGDGYSSGAPSSQCGSLTPGHDLAPLNNANSPFTINVSTGCLENIARSLLWARGLIVFSVMRIQSFRCGFWYNNILYNKQLHSENCVNFRIFIGKKSNTPSVGYPEKRISGTGAFVHVYNWCIMYSNPFISMINNGRERFFGQPVVCAIPLIHNFRLFPLPCLSIIRRPAKITSIKVSTYLSHMRRIMRNMGVLQMRNRPFLCGYYIRIMRIWNSLKIRIFVKIVRLRVSDNDAAAIRFVVSYAPSILK